MLNFKYCLILLIVSKISLTKKYKFMCIQLKDNCIESEVESIKVNICTTTFRIEEVLEKDDVRKIIDKEQYVVIDRERWGLISVDGVQHNCENEVNDKYIEIEGDYKLYRHRSITDKFTDSQYTPKGCLTCNDKVIQTYEFISEKHHKNCNFCSEIRDDLNDNPKSQWREIVINFDEEKGDKEVEEDKKDEDKRII